ncbi:MAG: type II toxin-antitoxin system VapC family toxin [Bacteroidales bacterium]|nr:type II toxin-antitoxin system VapC family toxin [Bacteroidales bacterium]
MENRRIIVDTSIFIEYLRKKNKQNTLLYKIPNDTKLYVSTVTVFELFAGAFNEKKQKDIDIILSGVVIEAFTYQTALFSANIYNNLRKKNRLIEFRDIFIAATALSKNLPVLTMNKKHFKNIDGLLLI